ncbi:DUF943 family protein [Tatumella terrea]|uniref:DUF943 family protein n=1 Tax=Tatumella terrea TaxID=419007 RepID=A0ABW1VWH4_9GAMM
MRANIKNILLVLLITVGTLTGYIIWLNLRSVEIIAIHNDGNYSSILVKNFPITDRGKTDWWLKNKDIIKSRYNIPKPATYGGYDVTFWNFGEGYKEDKYDRLCFEDMQTKINCIDKEPVFTIKRFNYEREIFITYEGRYKLNDKGKLMKFRRE